MREELGERNCEREQNRQAKNGGGAEGDSLYEKQIERGDIGERGGRGRERESLTRKLLRKLLKWAGHMARKEGERLTKRADALRVERRI